MSDFKPGLVVVITGASDGIGKAAAIEFAKRKTRLVLLARNEEKLAEAQRECVALGAECITVPTDVKSAVEVEAAAQKAVLHFGQIDVWINNAGVAAVGSFNDVPLDDHHNVLETNVMGYFNGAHSALSRFRKQRHGTLINNASICSRLTIPKMTSYNASKFAIRGLTLSLRQELWLEGLRDVHVCLLNPAIVDTQVFEHAQNFTGEEMKLKFPKTTPEHVALAMVSLVAHPKREKFVGPFARLGTFGFTLLPGFTGMVLAWFTTQFFFGGAESKEIFRK